VEQNADTPLETRGVCGPAGLIRVGSRSHRDSRYLALVRSFESEREIVHGSVGAKIGLIADARADYLVYPGGSTREWDLCAPEALLVGAGGRVSDLEGNPLRYNKENSANPGGVLASSGPCHDTLLCRIREHARASRPGGCSETEA
jgi:3'(2'), 5'-bisphosphate nucleotidase